MIVKRIAIAGLIFALFKYFTPANPGTGFFVILLVLFGRESTWRSLTISIPRPLLFKTLRLILPLCIANAGLSTSVILIWSYFKPDYIASFLLEQESQINAFFIVVVIAPIYEELIFRVALLGRLEKKLNTNIAITLSALLFGLLHSMGSPGITIVGLVLGYVYTKTRIIWVSILLHAINNFIGWGFIVWGPRSLEGFVFSGRWVLNEFQSYGIYYVMGAIVGMSLVWFLLRREWNFLSLKLRSQSSDK